MKYSSESNDLTFSCSHSSKLEILLKEQTHYLSSRINNEKMNLTKTENTFEFKLSSEETILSHFEFV